MPIKDIIARGIGFAPGSVQYIVTHGFGIGAAIIVTIPPWQTLRLKPESMTRALQRENTQLSLPVEGQVIRRRTDD